MEVLSIINAKKATVACVSRQLMSIYFMLESYSRVVEEELRNTKVSKLIHYVVTKIIANVLHDFYKFNTFFFFILFLILLEI